MRTNKLLYKIKVSQEKKCTFCTDSIETIEHIFWTCPKVFDVWEELNKWIYSKVQIELPLNLDIVLFGILEKNRKKLHKKSHNTINQILYIQNKNAMWTSKYCSPKKLS